MLYEGGIRVPFLISWPAAIEGGTTIDDPVIALDFFPTILDAAGIEQPDELDLNGVSLLPQMTGASDTKPHETLYWRYSDGKGFAVRHGKYKLVNQHMQELSLFDMEQDPVEMHNLANDLPEITKKLLNLYDNWNNKNINALWEDPHIPNVEKQENQRQKIRNRASAGEPDN